MDKRKNYYIITDTETANGMNAPLVYNISFAIIDKRGKIYAFRSFIVREVFFGMMELMKSAYYADKIPKYLEMIDKGEIEVVSYATAKKIFREMCKEWNVKAIIAHNMRFDYLSTNTTERFLTDSRSRYFFPYGVELWDTMRMSRDTICKQKTYKKWCEENGFMTKQNKPKATAEILYRYISNNNQFIEEHMALEDILIEKEIFAHCIRQHKPMRKKCFND